MEFHKYLVPIRSQKLFLFPVYKCHFVFNGDHYLYVSDIRHSSRIRFLRFFEIQKTRLFTFFEVSCQKNVKNVESVVQVFTFLHFKIANEHFTVNNYTHLVLYIQHYIKTVHFWLKYNRLAIVRKTAKLIEGGHRGLQDYRHIC